MFSHRPSGLTLVEMLVVIAIIGLLVGLGIPAIQASREAGRRAQCAANLSQFGKALHDYQSSRNAFPPAMPAIGNNPKNGSNLWYAPHVSLLPYVEQSALAAPVNLQQPIGPDLWQPPSASGIGNITWARLPVFLCPSDANSHAQWPANNYRVCTGPGTSQAPTNATVDGGLGAFVALRACTAADFRDGLSTTIGVSEKLMGSGTPGGYSRRLDFWYSGAALLGKLTPDQMATACMSLSGPPAQSFAYSGGTWFFAGYENTWYNHVLAPNSAIPDCSKDFMIAGSSPTSGGAFQASSYHPGGVNCLFMDGSVRFLTDEVNLVVWRALSTRAVGDVANLGM